jgi:hypothetical protein
MISDIDRQDILESLLAGEDPNRGDSRWSELLAGDDLYWVIALAIERLLHDPNNEDWSHLLGLAIKHTIPRLDTSTLEQELTLLIPELRNMKIDEPDMRWYWLMAELQENHNVTPEEGPRRRWPSPDNPASQVVLVVHESMTATRSPDSLRSQVELLLATYPWLQTALRYHRLNYAINATQNQAPDDLAGRLSSLGEFARRRALRIESAVQRRPYYGSPEIDGGIVRCEFRLPLSNEDTWQLMLEDRSLGSIHLRREPSGAVSVLESSGAWASCAPAGGSWRIRRAAESIAPSDPSVSSRRGTLYIEPELGETDVKLTIIWSSKGDPNG